MAYDVNKTDGSRVVIVPDRTLQSVAGISLLGKNYSSYGEIIAENMVRMVENFSNTDTSYRDEGAPSNPLDGQVYFNRTEKTLKVYNNGAWLPVGGAPTYTGMDMTKIVDTGGGLREAITVRVNGNIVVIISGDSESYTPAELWNQFPLISPGINFSNAQGAGGDLVYKLRGRAIEAEFADMAEIYTSDMELVPGNIVKLGGDAEITKTTEEFDTSVFGIISTAPGVLLNSKDKLKTFAYPVALKGRVPCVVKGIVRKGQRIVASGIAGIGMATDEFNPSATVGRAISEHLDTDTGVVEVAVGAR